MKTMIRKTKMLLPAILASLTFATAAEAGLITVIDVNGDRTDFQQVDAGQSAGVAFTLGGTLFDTTILPDIFCQTCTGLLLLMQNNVGPDAELTDLVAAVEFADGAAPGVAGGDLDAGTYFLVLQITSGFAGWIGNDNALVDETFGSFYELSLFADELNTDSTFAGRSNFSALFGFDYFFSVDGETVTVPEPGTLALLLFGLLALASRRRTMRT